MILKEFFDEDILEEEVILEWAKKVSNSMRKRSHPRFYHFTR